MSIWLELALGAANVFAIFYAVKGIMDDARANSNRQLIDELLGCSRRKAKLERERASKKKKCSEKTNTWIYLGSSFRTEVDASGNTVLIVENGNGGQVRHAFGRGIVRSIRAVGGKVVVTGKQLNADNLSEEVEKLDRAIKALEEAIDNITSEILT